MTSFRHLRIRRQARLIRTVTPPGSDGRKQFHEFPAMFRSRGAAGKIELDLGAVLLRLEAWPAGNGGPQDRVARFALGEL